MNQFICRRRRERAATLKEGAFRLDVKKKFFMMSGEAPEQVAQRGCGCPTIRSGQDQGGWGFEQLDLVKYVPAHKQVGWTS